MKLLNVPFIIITLSTITGIILGYYTTFSLETSLIIFIISIGLLLFTWHHSKKIFNESYTFTFSAIAAFILFGTVLVQIHNPKNDSKHYSHILNQKNDQKKEIGIRFYIKERLKPTSYYNKYIVSIKFIEENQAKGNLLLQVPKDTTNSILAVGETYTVLTKLKSIPNPLNPNQFDYAQYLSNLYIYHKTTVSPHQLINNYEEQKSLFSLADQIRKNINLKLSKYSFSPEQLSIINALILGQRQDIDQEVFENYRDAGAIHILAVSGLHVGILLLILNLILKPLLRFLRKGKTIVLLITIFLLWCFAILAGLSPSVLRAVTMFSFLAIGIQLRSQTSIYNSLFVSMFILLCFNPLLLFSVGFQLSYLAVFAIVWIQPIIARQYYPKFYISKKLWETFTVTISAQLGLLPLSLFYFHQFPILFFVSNLIIIPFLGIILGFGITVIILALIGILPQAVPDLFGACIDIMNTIIAWVADQKTFLITDIPFSWRMLITLYIILIMAITLFERYEKRKLYWTVIPIIVMFLVLTFEKQHALQKQELVIFQNQRNTTLGVLDSKKLHLYSRKYISDKTQHFLFGNYLIQNQAMADSSVISLKNMYSYKNQMILVIDSSSIYLKKQLRPDIVLLIDSPKIHLDRMIDSLQPKQIIADGSNFKSYIDRWETSCKKRKIPFHRTDKKGAFILE
ncbi:ComEC/Rec2 family competence protein [Aquimarina celericrescens]|uniref:ComEC/Rec2 family competence protein n=1 Tax=Aquimarina celericrescens TaxID=1964542 RepID=A0ABW5B343_9FLAO|nr:ComEC family competence protein [Aquimarina celericrescens]